MTNRNFRQIINLLDLRWQRRVPVIHQTETAECGLGLPSNDMRSFW
ncbi:Colicin V secretion/processing ATP-binding protein CvaB [Escherichia coli]|uniref:Colicin V secretion/processing ATP-binding protein CvaB n=1 Tax=Escherichia coli TaxID=562 RepID=A0A376ZUQ9_ECOLX|nr:Colicin V secretion/processing ATP-binding protein CvaB [Escherichia coli]